MRAKSGLIPYICRGNVQTQPFSTHAGTEAKTVLWWIQLLPTFRIQKLVKEKVGLTSSQRRLQPHSGCHNPLQPRRWGEHLPACNLCSKVPLTPEMLGCFLWHQWQHRSRAHGCNASGLLPDPKMKLRGVCWSCSVCKHGCLLLLLSQTLLLLEIECATAIESLTSVQRLKAGSRKQIVTYGLLKFLLPLLCNSFSLLSALLNIFEFIWFWHFLPLFL